MSISIPDFWKLAIDSQLLNLEQCRQYGEAFGNVKGAATQSNARTLAEWLTADNVLSRYQAQVLLAGRAGPFVYGEYKVYDRIKPGLLRSVFPAVHVPSQHPVTLFFLPETPPIDETRWAEVLAGSSSAIAIHDANVGRCHELLDAGGYKFVVMEHLAGATAVKRIAASGALPAEEACFVVHQIALALSRLHGVGRIHGELQPSSIWLGDDGEVKLLQAPLSRLPFTPPAGLDHSASPQSLQAADYAAPELIQPDRARDELTDMYGLGCMFYELLSGRVPFAGGDLHEKMTCHATKAIEPLDALGVATQPLAQVVTYMMAKDPGVRYQSAAAVVETIAAFIDPARWQKALPSPPPTLAAFDQALAHRQSTQHAMRPTELPEEEINEEFNIDVRASVSKPSDTPITEFPSIVDAPSVGAAVAMSTVVATGGTAASQAPVASGGAAKTASAADRFHNKKTSRTGLWIAAIAVAAVVAATALLGLRGCGDDSSDTHANQRESSGDTAASNDLAEGNNGDDNGANSAAPNGAGDSRPYELVDDDGSGLWAPPTHGAAADLAYLLPGAQLIFIARPAEILAQGADEVLFDALGPLFGPWMRQGLEMLAGMKLRDIDRLVIGVWNEGTRPTLSLVVHPIAASGEAVKRRDWQDPSAAAQHDGKTYYTSGGNAYFEIGEGAFAVTPKDDITEVIDAGDTAPAISRQMEQLLAASDADRHLTVLFQTAYLRNSGHHLFRGHTRPLASAIDELLGGDQDATAGLLSLHFGPLFFGELRLIGPVDKRPDTLARAVYRRMQSGQRKLIAAYGSGSKLSSHGRGVLSNFPRMMKTLVGNTRHGADGPQAVLRFYLPPDAAHNVIMGTELALYDSAVVGPGVVATPSAAKSIHEKLKQTISMSFDKEELQEALATFTELTGIEHKFVGSDLEDDGIIRNKAVTKFSEINRPAGEVLRRLLIQGNPVKVDRTDDPEMKLVYVIRQNTATGRDAVFLTTRAAAAQRGEKLPAEFAIKR